MKSDLIRNRRIELGLSIKDVAQKCGVTEATVSRWETGGIGNLKRHRIAMLADILNVPPSTLIDLGVSVDGMELMHVSEKEKTMLDRYRTLKVSDKFHVETTVKRLWETDENGLLPDDPLERTSVFVGYLEDLSETQLQELLTFAEFLAEKSRKPAQP